LYGYTDPTSFGPVESTPQPLENGRASQESLCQFRLRKYRRQLPTGKQKLMKRIALALMLTLFAAITLTIAVTQQQGQSTAHDNT
jgi:hypothetical protein